MHIETVPRVLYFGTPVVLVSTSNKGGVSQSGTDVIGVVGRSILHVGSGRDLQDD